MRSMDMDIMVVSTLTQLSIVLEVREGGAQEE